jgi:hypothetical protein
VLEAGHEGSCSCALESMGLVVDGDGEMLVRHLVGWYGRGECEWPLKWVSAWWKIEGGGALIAGFDVV